MSIIRKSTESLSSEDKVIRYLQHSPNNLFSLQHRLRSCSENDSSSSSSSSVPDSLPRSDFSVESSVSDPVAHCSIISSNISSDEDLDFNLGFDDISDDEHVLNKNNTDAVTLFGESILDARINEFEEYLRQSSGSTIFNDEYDFDNDDAITTNYTEQQEQQQRASFLYDSTHTLCSQDRFSAYTEDEQETGIGKRSNSLSILRLNEKSTFLEKPPKKVVRFADKMGLDLESIRYMTPPDQTTTSIIQECVRLQLEQLRFAKKRLESPTICRRSTSSLSLPSPTKHYNLVSKNFISPINIIPIIYEKQVLLECLYTKDSVAYGTIRVHNLAYDKRVFIRLSQDEWNTTNDIQASHSMSYPHENTDIFSFEIVLPKSIDDMVGPKRILFAVCLQAVSQDFWDNNQGWNYVLDVFERR